MPKYMVQLSREEKTDLGIEWTFIESRDSQEALRGILHQLFKVKMSADLFESFFSEPIWARIAEQRKDNLYENGMPICVHAFKLEINKPCTLRAV